MRRTKTLVVTAVSAATLATLALSYHVLRSAQPDPVPPVTTDTVVTPLHAGDFNVRLITVDGRRWAYQVFVPANWSSSRKWPVIVALHGSAERGVDNTRQIHVGLANVVREQAATFPAIVVLPQIPERVWAPSFMPVVTSMLDTTIREFNGDVDRVVLTGLSYGGAMGYGMVEREPTRYAAFVPIAAPIMAGWMVTGPRRGRPSLDSTLPPVVSAMGRVPMWIFHGSNDPAAPVTDARYVAQAFKAAGAPVRYTEFAGVEHNSWDPAYHSPELIAWMIAQHR